MRINDWSSDVCSSDLSADAARLQLNLFNLTHGSPARGCAPGKGELMPQSIPLMAARLQRDVPTAESKVDDAIIALSSLMTSMVTARRESGAPAKTGQERNGVV